MRLKAREAVKNLQEISHMERNFNAKFLNEEVQSSVGFRQGQFLFMLY